MDKFWEWFRNKTGFTLPLWKNANRECWMLNLIGHMEEYLAIHGYGRGLKSDVFSKLREGKDFGELQFQNLSETIERVLK